MRLFLAVFFVLLSSSACATGKKKMHAPNDDFSYRVKGTEETGKISRGTQQDLFQLTKTWAWPLKMLSITSPFGGRHGEFHDGLDLKAESGTPIYSVSEGKVIYSGNRISGYGNMIVIKHGKELSTVYAHTSKLLVKKGTDVKRGDLIAYSGNTGRSSGPHLHFEVRLGVKAINPLYVLPKRGYEGLPNSSSGRMLASTSPAILSAPAPKNKGLAPPVAKRRTVAVANRGSSKTSARVVSSNSRISQSAAIRPSHVYRRVREEPRVVTQKDLKHRRLVRTPPSTESS